MKHLHVRRESIEAAVQGGVEREIVGSAPPETFDLGDSYRVEVYRATDKLLDFFPF
jgi:hypothetical protein